MALVWITHKIWCAIKQRNQTKQLGLRTSYVMGEESKFDVWSRYYIYFWINNLGKCMNPYSSQQWVK